MDTEVRGSRLAQERGFHDGRGKVVSLLCVLALAVAACGEDEGAVTTPADTTATSGVGVATTVADVMVATPTGGTLELVRARGALRCGVSDSVIGFSEPREDGSFTGFDADFCRALAAAIFGDSNAIEFIGTTTAARFALLAGGEVDVLFRATTWTQSRDSELGADFGPTIFYEGQRIMGRAAFGFTAASTVADAHGARVCSNAGTTTEKNITEAARVVGAEIELVTVERTPEAMELFRAGSCDLVTSGGSYLLGERFAAVASGEIGEGDWIIFPSSPISKEPYSPVYRQNDSQWADIINWTVYALIIADEKGITSANIDEMVANPPDPEAARLLGAGEDQLQTKMGLPADAFAQAIRAVGNYDEIHERNLRPLGMPRTGSLNARWTEGGLMYAPPAR